MLKQYGNLYAIWSSFDLLFKHIHIHMSSEHYWDDQQVIYIIVTIVGRAFFSSSQSQYDKRGSRLWTRVIGSKDVWSYWFYCWFINDYQGKITIISISQNICYTSFITWSHIHDIQRRRLNTVDGKIVSVYHRFVNGNRR